MFVLEMRSRLTASFVGSRLGPGETEAPGDLCLLFACEVSSKVVLFIFAMLDFFDLVSIFWCVFATKSGEGLLLVLAVGSSFLKSSLGVFLSLSTLEGVAESSLRFSAVARDSDGSRSRGLLMLSLREWMPYE